MINKNHPVSISNGYRLQWEPAQDCHVLLYPEGLIKLNPTASLILATINGERNVSQIVAELNKQFPGADLKSDVEEFLETAVENKWITLSKQVLE